MRARTGRICFVPHAREEIAVCVCVCVHVWTLASSMDAPAKHHLRLWCQETVAFVWRQTAQYDLAGGALSLSPFLSVFLALFYYTTFFLPALLYFLYFFLSSTAFLIAPKYPCTAAELWQGNEKTKKTTTLFCLSDFHGTNWNWNIILSSSTRLFL